MGRRLLKTWHATRGESPTDLATAVGATLEATLPVAFGVVCASFRAAPRAAVEAFAYTRLAATASCAMRLLPVGQREAHARLASALRQLPGVVDGIERRASCGSRPGTFAPLLDLAAMSQPYVHSRLFLS
jgi:urease accessory protein UreF